MPNPILVETLSPRPETVDSRDQYDEALLADLVLWLEDEKWKIWSHHSVDCYEYEDRDLILTPGMDVELDDESYFRIIFIVKEMRNDFRERARFYGYRFLQCGEPPLTLTREEHNLYTDDEDMCLILHRKPNEICWLVNTLDDNPLDKRVQSFKAVLPAQITRCVQIKITNCPFPEFNKLASNNGNRFESVGFDLICRVKIIRTWPNEKTKSQGFHRYVTKTIEPIKPHECDEKLAITEQELLRMFRDTIVPGGDHRGIYQAEMNRRLWEIQELERAERNLQQAGIFASGFSAADLRLKYQPLFGATSRFHDHGSEIGLLDLSRPQCTTIDLTNDFDEFWRRTSSKCTGPKANFKLQRYSFGDAFCGCGGASRAAVEAGFHVSYAFDHNLEACSTYEKNFPGTKLANIDCFKFIQDPKYPKVVDILHLSPPCQPFSKAHTVSSEDRDKLNRACLSAIEQLLRVARPRVVTVENADGLFTLSDHQEYFNHLTGAFVAMGYSIQARVVRLADYGAAQPRYRLVIIAACPGQRNPGFPLITHSDMKFPTPGTKPHTTINDAIRDIPDGWRDHDLINARIIQRPEIDGNCLGKTLTTSNGDSYHPEGFRRYTTRELANLQSFPLYHEFGNGLSRCKKEKQIGNAVPPMPFFTIFRHIREFLEQADAEDIDKVIYVGSSRKDKVIVSID